MIDAVCIKTKFSLIKLEKKKEDSYIMSIVYNKL